MEIINKHRKHWGWTLLVIAIAGLLGICLGSRWLARPEVCAKRIQKAIWQSEKETQRLIDNDADNEQYDKQGIGLYVFVNDTLQYWNNNAVGPKLIRRKITMGRDTICNLLTGDYYVKSFEKDNKSYYVFKLLNTTYKLENQYFENRFLESVLPRNKTVSLNDSSGYEIRSSKGELLTYCQIGETDSTTVTTVKIAYILSLLLLLTASALLIVKPTQTSKKARYFKVEYGIIAILALSALGTYLYYRWEQRRENERMKALAETLFEKRDVNFETSFSAFSEQLKSDTALRDMVFAESNVLADVILGYSKALLFDETLKSYSSALTVCDPDEEITIQPEGYVTDCDGYFLEKLANNDKQRIGENLYLIDYNTLDPNYLAKIKVYSKDSLQHKTLYFEFYKPIAPEGFGFPQLLQKTDNQKHTDYSVAYYKNGILVYKYGRYIYPSFIKNLNIKENYFTIEGESKHFTKGNETNNTLVISTPRKGWSAKTAPFGVFFLGLLVPYLFIYWLIKPKEKHRWKDRSFRRRMQTLVFWTMALAVITVGPVSVIYMRSLYNQKTTEKQFETTITLANEMANDLDYKSLLETSSRDTWTDILQHYAETFFTDINIYRLDGRLLATSRQEIYELTLQAPIMNADAYQNMHRNKALYYTHEERLGKGVYASAYIPLSDENGNTLAYLNTPYFSSVTDLHKEIRNFVLTYINIVLVLLGFALLLVLRITNRLTRPLTLIQNKLGNIEIDQKNEPIDWKGNDEIGALVKQYNQMIVKLEKSTEELKRTTTESAWRGVARQVAHEIKNSLTPMRLSVQMLQRNSENGKATPEQIQRTTNTLIEQIDALSDIASSFSRYAKLPENHPEPLDLAELIANIINLYDNTENIVFKFDYDSSINHVFEGDKTNLNSAIGNIIKNATQAIGSHSKGLVEVSLKATENQYLIAIKDNGKGIKEEDKKMIFVPNFTTKSGGSGVGLSLAYDIIHAAGGKISFESEENVGTVFTIELPR